MIKKCPKKTVIFSQMVPVVEAITEDLKSYGVGTVMVTGNTRIAMMRLINSEMIPIL